VTVAAISRQSARKPPNRDCLSRHEKLRRVWWLRWRCFLLPPDVSGATGAIPIASGLLKLPTMLIPRAFAEGLAIRYADTHYGLHTPYHMSDAACEAPKDQCMERLFEEIAKQHGVPVQQASSSLGPTAPILT
jgi:hypothetical protein